MSGDLIKITVVIIIAALLIVTLRQHAAEHSFLLLLAAVSIVMLFCFGRVFDAFAKFETLFAKGGSGTGAYFTVALKALGISYVTTFASDLCRDYGLSALAHSAETAGKIAIFILSFPLVESLLDVTLNFAGL